MGDAPQLGIERREHPVERLAVPARGELQQLRERHLRAVIVTAH